MNPIITANQLEELMNEGSDILICDCRFDLTNAKAGYEIYKTAHITGAIYVNVDQDLSGKKTGSNGRHPLPYCQKTGPRHVNDWGSLITPMLLPMIVMAGPSQVVYGGCYAPLAMRPCKS